MKRYLKMPEEIIDALQAGKTLHNRYSQWVLYNGFIMRKDKNSSNWSVNDSLCSRFDDEIYIDEPEQLKLKVGKFYKTRNGSKAFIYAQIGSIYFYPFYVAVIGKLDTCKVNAEGKQADDEQLPLDLVAPWEEQ